MLSYKDLSESTVEELNNSVYVWDLDYYSLRTLYLAEQMVDNNWSLRQLAKETCLIQKTQICDDFHKRLAGLSIVLYDRVMYQLKKRAVR